MPQPQYTQEAVEGMSNHDLAAELREWARARKYVSIQRQAQGKEALDYILLVEAAERLEGLPDRIRTVIKVVPLDG